MSPHEEPRDEEQFSQPLAGLLVADFSRVLAGPLTTMTLADLGARVIKVEHPDTGDDTRSWGPPYSATGATYFESVNRNKESITLDLSNPSDQKTAQELALRADVLVENLKPGGMARYGLGYEDLKAENPGLVYASISGFGDKQGAELPGYDFIVQALGGLMSITGEAEGSPLKVGVALVDVLTSKDATSGILAALVARSRHGRGAHIKANLLSSLQGALANQGQAFLGAGVVPVRLGNVHPSIAPYQLLATKDAPIAVACGNNSQFGKLCAVLGVAHLAEDPRFSSNALRVKRRSELESLLEDALKAYTANEWQTRLSEAGVPVGQVLDIAGGIDFAEKLGLEPTVEVVGEHGETVGRQLRHPLTWDPPLPRKASAPPALGQHSQDVLAWLRSSPSDEPAKPSQEQS